MSRVGKMPIAVPQGVDVQITAEAITVKGGLGTLSMPANSLVVVTNDAGVLKVAPANESVAANAMSGTIRALLANNVNGVSKGFEKKLNLVGVGFRAQATGQKLNLQIGFSHPVVKDMPAGIKVETPAPTEILIKGSDRQVVGQTAATGGVVDLSRPHFRVRHQLFHVVHRHARVHHQKQGDFSHQHHWREILVHVEGQLAEQRRIDGRRA